jgi:hypothetical protein
LVGKRTPKAGAIEEKKTMSELIISGYHGYERKKGNSYAVATTFGGMDLIILNKIPPADRANIENHIEDILEHEQLHISLHKIDSQASVELDNILPFLHSMYVLKRKISKNLSLQ